MGSALEAHAEVHGAAIARRVQRLDAVPPRVLEVPVEHVLQLRLQLPPRRKLQHRAQVYQHKAAELAGGVGAFQVGPGLSREAAIYHQAPRNALLEAG